MMQVLLNHLNQQFYVTTNLTGKKQVKYEIEIYYSDIGQSYSYFYKETGAYNAESNYWEAWESTAG